VDPKMFGSQKNLNGNSALNDYVSTGHENSQYGTYLSKMLKQPVKTDKHKDFYSMAIDMNKDGKEVYYDNQVKKIQTTDTLRNPTQDSTNVFDNCKI